MNKYKDTNIFGEKTFEKNIFLRRLNIPLALSKLYDSGFILNVDEKKWSSKMVRRSIWGIRSSVRYSKKLKSEIKYQTISAYLSDGTT